MTTTRQMSFAPVKAQVDAQMHWKDRLTFDGAFNFSGSIYNQTLPLPNWAANHASTKFMVVCSDHSAGPHLCPSNTKVTAVFGQANLCWDHWHDLVPALRCLYHPNGHDFAPWELHICAACKALLCEDHVEWSGNDDALCKSCYMSHSPCEECGTWTSTSCDECNSTICDEHIIESTDDEDADHTIYQCAKCATNFHLPPHIWGSVVVAQGSTSTSWRTQWDLQICRKIKPAMAAADYYLLLALRDDLLLSRRAGNGYRELAFLRIEAADMLKALVETFDPVFCRYTDMVVGGELRYANQLGLPNNRSVAWTAWYQIREQMGVKALELAASRFKSDFAGKGSFGGQPWATIATTLQARLTGRITPELWLDRVFNLQHNCGMLLNKVPWGDDITYIQSLIGPCHSVDPPRWTDLLALASGHVWDLWRFYARTAGAVQMDHRDPVDRIPRTPPDHYVNSREHLRQALEVPYSDYVRTMP